MTPIEHMYLVFLFIAYTALFIAMFVFLGRMLAKSRQLEDEVRLLKEAWLADEGDRSPVHSERNVPAAPSVHRKEIGS